MGRAPCCDKANVKKGPWSPEEDAKLKSYIEQHGTGGNWIALPQKIGLKRCGKSCRLRWLNYLRPNIKHGGFSEEEDNIICNLYISIGSRWSIIAAQLPGRTDNDIKNYWNTRLKKKLLGKQRKEHHSRRGGNGSKQDMKRGNGKAMVSATSDHSINNNHNNQNPYWPELPVLAPIPYSNQEHRFNDHNSIRKLLIKLGGKFSDDDQPIHNSTNPQLFPTEVSNTDHHHHQPLYDQCINNNIPSSASVEALNYSTAGAQFAQTDHYGGDNNAVVGGLQMLQGGFPAGLDEMAYSNQLKLDGLEFLVGENMINNVITGINISSSTIHCSDGMSSLVNYPDPVEPNCEGMQQRFLLQECGLDNDQFGYPGEL